MNLYCATLASQTHVLFLAGKCDVLARPFFAIVNQTQIAQTHCSSLCHSAFSRNVIIDTENISQVFSRTCIMPLAISRLAGDQTIPNLSLFHASCRFYSRRLYIRTPCPTGTRFPFYHPRYLSTHQPGPINAVPPNLDRYVCLLAR